MQRGGFREERDGGREAGKGNQEMEREELVTVRCLSPPSGVHRGPFFNFSVY